MATDLPEGIDIRCCDCLSAEGLPSLAEGSVDLILTDPPYFEVKDEEWDRQWKSAEAYVDWIGLLCEQWHRALKPGGSLYVFASPEMAARVECKVREWFKVINNITWRKAAKSYAEKYGPENFRGYVEMSERIIFAENYGNDHFQRGHVFNSVVEYLRAERDAAGLQNGEIDDLCGWRTKAFHFFAPSGSNFCFPTAENYAALRNALPGRFLRPYQDLRREYESLCEKYEALRRHFSVTSDVPYTDVWDFPTVQAYPGKHPCEKPLAMMEHIIKASSRPGDLVIDPFLGSGTTADACYRLNRRCIGMEINPAYIDIAKRRLSQLRLPV